MNVLILAGYSRIAKIVEKRILEEKRFELENNPTAFFLIPMRLSFEKSVVGVI